MPTVTSTNPLANTLGTQVPLTSSTVPQPASPQANLTPEAFKSLLVAKYPKGVSSNGTPYSQMDATALTQAVVTKYPNGKTNAGIPYSSYLPQSNVSQNNPQGGFLAQAGGDFNDTLNSVAGTLSQTAQGQVDPNPLLNIGSGLLQAGGEVASGVGNLVNTAATNLPLIGGILKSGENLAGKGIQAAANTPLGQSIVQPIESVATAHPEIASDLGAAANIGSLLYGGGAAKDLLEGVANTALKGSTDAIYDAVAPKLTAGETADAIAQRGTSNKGLLRTTVLNKDPNVQNIADTVRTNVPNFDPSKPLTSNVNAIKNVVSKMGLDLKNQVTTAGDGRIFPIQELASKLNSIEKPVMVASDKTLNKAYGNVVNKALDIVKTSGGKVSNLLDARQEFDSFIKKQFPNLYSSDTLTPMRSAIKDVRNTITNFTAENLPKEVGLKANLLTQHKLLNAVENMSEKASSGTTKELGTTALTRLASRHPLLKTGGKALVRGALLGTGMKGAESLIP